jgi:hypothetical protein
MEKTEKKLFEEALAAYGIQEEYVFASAVRGDEVTVVTNGGFKVRYKHGDSPEKLTYAQVTGKLKEEETAFLPKLGQRFKMNEVVKRFTK